MPIAVVNRVINFAVYTIVIGIFLWILDEILDFVFDYLGYKDYTYHDDVYEKITTYLRIFEYIIWLIAFFAWIGLALGTA